MESEQGKDPGQKTRTLYTANGSTEQYRDHLATSIKITIKKKNYNQTLDLVILPLGIYIPLYTSKMTYVQVHSICII